ncbi:MAG: HIT family protein [Fluviibacter sp.]|jgi:diadenosine tetraphosphate (Ap4A) HIT family hydrolase
MTQKNCPLCQTDGEDILFNNALYRIVAVNDPAWPGFCRVIMNRHAAEMTDLPIEDRSAIMKAVCVTETILRDLMHPDKINLASLGNVVPHVHWHIIPRWKEDSHFPDPIWANAKREWTNKPTVDNQEIAARLKACLG